MFPSVTDTQGLVLSEAALYRLPLITLDPRLPLGTTDATAMGDPAALASRMGALARDPLVRRRAGEQAWLSVYRMQERSRESLLSVVGAYARKSVVRDAQAQVGADRGAHRGDERIGT